MMHERFKMPVNPCAQVEPGSQGRVTCTKPFRHEGNHCMHDQGGGILVSWSNTPPPQATEPAE